MSTSISSTSSATLSSALFDKLDTRKKGYIDQADLQPAAGPAGDDSKTAQAFAAIDRDSDGKVSKSELSTAIDKVGEQLGAQRDASRVRASGAQQPGHAGGPPPGGGAGGPPPGGGANSAKATSSGAGSDTTTKYVAAADTNGDGTVSDAEETAYEQLEAAAAAKAQSQVAQYKAAGASDDRGASAPKAIDVSA